MNRILNKPYYTKRGDVYFLYHPVYEKEGDKTSHHLPYFTKEKIMGQYNLLDELQSHSVSLYGEKAEELKN